jgi:hypothetical protein
MHQISPNSADVSIYNQNIGKLHRHLESILILLGTF